MIHANDTIFFRWSIASCFWAMSMVSTAHATVPTVALGNKINSSINSQKEIIAQDTNEKKHDITKTYTSSRVSTTLQDPALKKAAESQNEKIVKYSTIEKEEREIQTLQPKQQMRNSIEHNRILLAFGLTSLVFIVLSLLRFFKKTRQNHQLQIDNLLRRNAELEIQVQGLQEANEALRQFAFASAHDLKEPLRNISSFVGVIQRRYAPLLPPEATEYMGYITGGVSRMNTLLSDLLSYAMVVMDKQQNNTESVDIEKVITEVKDNLQTTIAEKNAKILCLGALPKVQMSHLHSTQLFQNLISNSLKFVTQPPIVEIESQQTEKEVLITVQDNGIGMKQEHSGKVFQLFQRLNRNSIEGSGIGLNICKTIVEKYNGKIWFESAEGQGTRFFISLPKAA